MRATRALLALALVHPTAALPGAERRPLQEDWRVTLDRGPSDLLNEGQAGPVELKIGRAVYRLLWDPPSCPGSAAARRELQAAAPELPASMPSSMRNLAALGADPELDLAGIATEVEFLFVDGVATTPIVEKQRLSPEEVNALVTQSAR